MGRDDPGQSKGRACPHLHAKPCMGTPHYDRPTSVLQRGDVQDYAAKGRRPMEGPTGGALPSAARSAQF